MTKLILLPGNSPSNRPWIKNIAKLLAPSYTSSLLLEYHNWAVPDRDIDLELELNRLAKLINPAKPHVVFAKSIGTALALKAVKDKILHPEKCVFVGTPVIWARNRQIALDDWIDDFDLPTLYIQETADPFMPSLELRKYLINKHVKNYSYVEVPGSNHKYPDLNNITRLAKNFFFPQIN